MSALRGARWPSQGSTVVIVPGLRDAVEQHWQSLLEARLREHGRRVVAVAPMGRDALDRAQRVAALDEAMDRVDGAALLVAHSAGCLTVAHWAAGRAGATGAVRGALLAVPPDFETPMPAAYPGIEALRANGWLPVPRGPLGLRAIVAASLDDPLARIERVRQLAIDWGADCVELGAVGHLNPASGYGPWPRAEEFLQQLDASS